MKAFIYGLFALLASATLGLTESIQRLPQREIDERRQLGLHLLSLAPDVDPVWKTMQEIYELKRQHKHFFDLTDVYRAGSHPTFPYGPPVERESYGGLRHQYQVRQLSSRIQLNGMKSWMTTLTAFETRFYETQTGVDAAIWIRDTVARMIRSNPGCGASVNLFTHSWAQSSVIARIPGRRNGPLTIVGAHLDTIDDFNFTARAPGADDDASGVINLMEAFRILLQSGFRPENPVEFQWYSAEEVGLRGSVDIATRYKDTNVRVKGMLQLDMTAYVKPGTSRPTVGLISDYTNADLNTFVASLIEEYTNLGWVYDFCGYGCSDHASWNRTGFPAAFPFESTFDSFNQNIHSAADLTTVDGFSWAHTVEYTKLVLGFAYELAN